MLFDCAIKILFFDLIWTISLNKWDLENWVVKCEGDHNRLKNKKIYVKHERSDIY